MNCPNCESKQNKLVDIIIDSTSIVREKTCIQCHFEFNTIEEIITDAFLVHKKDGSREQFDREKLISSLLHSTHKKGATQQTVTDLAAEVESQIVSSGNEIESRLLAEIVMLKLKNLDTLGYIRYAASYKTFVSISEFVDEMHEVVKTNPQVPDEQLLLLID
jgi:transcriptional repressor NrdR